MRGQNTNIHFKETDWKAIKSLFPYLLEFKGRIILALLFLIAAKLASVGLPFLLKSIVDTLDGVGNTALPHSLTDAPTLITLPLGLLLAYGAVRLSGVVFGEIRDTLFGRVTERAMRRLSLKVFKHLHALDLGYHLDRKTGGVSRDIERGAKGISFLLRFMIFNIAPTLLEIGMVAVILGWKYHIGYGLIVLVAVVAYIAFSVITTEWRTQFLREVNEAESNSSTQAVDSLLNFETVKYFANEQLEAKRYDQELLAWESARRRNRLSLFALNSGQAAIIAISMTLTMIMAGKNVTSGVMTIGDFVLINAFMMQIFMPLNFLGFVYREMKGSLANIERLFSILETVPAIQDKPEATTLQVTKGEISFTDVNFSFDKDRPILHKISFSIKANQKVAIVGASGSGKSTLLKLLLRLYETEGGVIQIDNQDIRDVTQASLRRSLAVVPQDTVLFNTSLLENVRYGRPSASDSEVIQALALANLEDFIQQLPKGVHTLVGERGLKLSGGEKQRVSIARALLTQARILLFDEATSSLDSQSEQTVLSGIKQKTNDLSSMDLSSTEAPKNHSHTTLVIAHRLSTIVDADRILVLDNGKLIEEGSHQELLSRNGHYTMLWRIQLEDRQQN